MSRGWAKASACCFNVCLTCAILCEMILFRQSSSSSLHRLAGSPLDRFPSYGFQVVIYDSSVISYSVGVPCPRPLPSSDLFNHVCYLCLFSYPDVCFSVPVCNVLHTYFHLCTAGSLFVAWLVSVHVSAPYIIAGNTQEL